MDRRVYTAALGLLVSLAVSVAAWLLFDVLLLFLFVPFVPFLLGRARRDSEADRDRGPPTVRACPVCGYRTRDPDHDYCPRDGHRLERPERD